MIRLLNEPLFKLVLISSGKDIFDKFPFKFYKRYLVSCTAPKIKPVHSWSMISAKESRIPGEEPALADKLSENSIIFHARRPHSTQEIPGNPDLRTHGEMTMTDGGLAFDGQESRAVSQIAPDDCVVNTEKCTNGLSFGTKLRFDKADESDGPRFIVDTGAHNPRMRGFTLFKQKGRLTAVVRSADREWMVSLGCEKR